ncbi:MAG: hypothetical protein AB1813_21225 [Verrucomicrobiota bacterium]|jgi:hypothetical protein
MRPNPKPSAVPALPARPKPITIVLQPGQELHIIAADISGPGGPTDSGSQSPPPRSDQPKKYPGGPGDSASQSPSPRP